ncbi:hypothetical protein KM043_015349 [Ampulex compressa]|nr:hypothetical protein KM043_015349 [Ampulex compressa]
MAETRTEGGGGRETEGETNLVKARTDETHAVKNIAASTNAYERTGARIWHATFSTAGWKQRWYLFDVCTSPPASSPNEIPSWRAGPATVDRDVSVRRTRRPHLEAPQKGRLSSTARAKLTRLLKTLRILLMEKSLNIEMEHRENAAR